MLLLLVHALRAEGEHRAVGRHHHNLAVEHHLTRRPSRREGREGLAQRRLEADHLGGGHVLEGAREEGDAAVAGHVHLQPLAVVLDLTRAGVGGVT